MSGDLTKVLLELQQTHWHSSGSETLWATPLGDNLFRLENSPFYAQGYSFLDVVFAEFDPEQGFPVVREVVRKSGHSTYAFRVENGVESNGTFSVYWEPLENIGCSFEGADNVLLSVDVPAETNIHEAYRLMQVGEDAGAWEFQEQDVGHEV
jgi:hypothetical protein